jgi:hypothetical protein
MSGHDEPHSHVLRPSTIILAPFMSVGVNMFAQLG